MLFLGTGTTCAFRPCLLFAFLLDLPTVSHVLHWEVIVSFISCFFKRSYNITTLRFRHSTWKVFFFFYLLLGKLNSSMSFSWGTQNLNPESFQLLQRGRFLCQNKALLKSPGHETDTRHWANLPAEAAGTRVSRRGETLVHYFTRKPASAH